jgi:flagellar biogenesis protein FliO
MDTVREYHAGSEPGNTGANTLTRWMHGLLGALRSIRIRNRTRTLKLCETLQLGDKRFLAVVQFNHQRLLIGSTSQSICLLQQLEVADVAEREVNDSRTNCSEIADE